MKRVVLLTALAGTLATAGLGLKAWRQHTAQAQEERAYNRAEMFLARGRPLEALAIHQYHGGQPRSGFDWKGLEFRALIAQINLPRLTALYLEDPARILNHEEGSLTVARAFLHLRQEPEFEAIRSAWRGRERDAVRWTLLDADRLLLEGEAAQAERLLQASSFAGTNDAPRLLRLALTKAGQDPAESARLLDAAATLAPLQPDTRVFRGQVLESLGRPAEARVEYVAAVVAAPQNPLWRDQLAEFYRRQGALDLALDTWREALAPPSLDAIWLKAAFWSRMLQPFDFRAVSNQPPAGRLAPVVALLQSHPPGHFLAPQAIMGRPQGHPAPRDRQELFWLRLAEDLLQGEEGPAAKALAARIPAEQSWAPDLERALMQILAYRQTGSLPARRPRPTPSGAATNLHPFFAALDAVAGTDPQAVEPGLASLLRSPHAFAAAFLAAGWREAALLLSPKEPLPLEAPDWLTYGLGQALRFNRGPEPALAFLAQHAGHGPADLLAAEIRLGMGDRDRGLAALKTLAGNDSEVGFRASWLLAVDSLDQGRFAEARDLVQSNPGLSASVTGRELLARILLAEGASDEASALYTRLAPESLEARAFLARSAFARRDWPQARRLTEELLGMRPDSIELRSNLVAIARAQAGADTTP